MARTKKKRPYVRKENKLKHAHELVERLQLQNFNLQKQVGQFSDQVSDLKIELSKKQAEVDASDQILRGAGDEIANVREALLQHQRTLDMATINASNNAMQNRDFIKSLATRNYIAPITKNVVGMNNEKAADKVVNVDGYGRRTA